ISSQGHFGENLSVHELAHQWWGDKITNTTWGDIWLNEGFASYAEALYFEDQFGSEYYHEYMDAMNFPFENTIFVEDTSVVKNIFTSTVYEKGAWLLHMLRHVVGDSTFFDILLAYSNDPRFAYGNATSAGFQDVCETVADTTLDWFFNAWLHQTGRPVYRHEWGATEVEGSPAVELTIIQTQAPQNGLFSMPLDIGITTDTGDTLVTVINDEEFQTFTIPLAAAPQALTIDPDDWVLKEIAVDPIDPGDGSPAAFALHQNYPNPFNTTTRIDYAVSSAADVEIVLYDLLGREVAELLHEPKHGGYHHLSWDGRDSSGRLMPSGVYFYRLTAIPLYGIRQPAYKRTLKLLLLR
ncbi:MAG: M1 family aminopeptidase, partial [Candidatus Neomarinimicrobiota bacterium]